MSSTIEVQRICEYCKMEFTARTTKTRYCSQRCNSRGYKANVKSLRIELSNNETQRIISKPIAEINAKPFLSVAETSNLLGISRRTVYRMIKRGELNTGKAGSRTIVQRLDIDKLFLKG